MVKVDPWGRVRGAMGRASKAGDIMDSGSDGERGEVAGREMLGRGFCKWRKIA